MHRGLTSTLDDGQQAMREWRWRSYLDHLEDLGYDLRNGDTLEDELPAQDQGEDRAGNAPASSILRQVGEPLGARQVVKQTLEQGRRDRTGLRCEAERRQRD